MYSQVFLSQTQCDHEKKKTLMSEGSKYRVYDFLINGWDFQLTSPYLWYQRY